ncbi:MAG TPA: glycosyltransferase family 2 protein, partial [Gemmatimonadaceae bacterium]
WRARGCPVRMMPNHGVAPTPQPFMMLEILFWTLVAPVVWCYVGYPLLIVVLARVRPHPTAAQHSPSLPSVTVVVAVRNERTYVARRVENILRQHYPPDRLDTIIVCNGSADGSEEIAREIAAADRRVRVLVSPAEQGKAGALNMAVASAHGDVIVFADARQTFAPDAVAKLVQPFEDPAVGAVTGRLVVNRGELASVEGVRLYWGLETRLRQAESRTGSVVGATGAIYGIRRPLFPGIPANLILDDVFVPLRIAMTGWRVVMATGAVAYDAPAGDQLLEYARKHRTMVGNLQLVRALPVLLSPHRNPLFVRFVSHKLLRLLAPFCFVAILIVSAALPGRAYRFLFAAQLALYAAGTAGLRFRVRAFSLPSAFVLVHAAVFAAVWRWRDDASQVWAPASPYPRSNAVAIDGGMLPPAAETLIPTPALSR